MSQNSEDRFDLIVIGAGPGGMCPARRPIGHAGCMY